MFYNPRNHYEVPVKVLQRIKDELKAEQVPQRKMKFSRRIEAEDSDEVSETDSVVAAYIDLFDKIKHVDSPKAIKERELLEAQGHQFWSITAG